MRKNAVYDYVVPLGDRCCTTHCLKHFNLRPWGQKLPFDWVSHGTLEARVDCVLNDFQDFLVPERLRKIEYIRPEQWKNWHFYDIKTKIRFVHDFPRDLPFDDGFIVALETVTPKINRMREIMRSGKRILFVYMVGEHVASRRLRGVVKKLRMRFNNDNIDLLVIESGVKTLFPFRRVRVARGITKFVVRMNLAAVFWADTTPEQFKELARIFKQIRVV